MLQNPPLPAEGPPRSPRSVKGMKLARPEDAVDEVMEDVEVMQDLEGRIAARQLAVEMESFLFLEKR